MNVPRKLFIALFCLAFFASAKASANYCSLDKIIVRAGKVNAAYEPIDIPRVDMKSLRDRAYPVRGRNGLAIPYANGHYQYPWARVLIKGESKYRYVQVGPYGTVEQAGKNPAIVLIFKDENFNRNTMARVYDAAKLKEEVDSLDFLKPGHYYNQPNLNLKPVYQNIPTKAQMTEEQISTFLTLHSTPTNPNAAQQKAGKQIAVTLKDNSVVIGELHSTSSSKLYKIGEKEYIIADIKAVELNSADFPNYYLRAARDLKDDPNRIARFVIDDGKIVRGRVISVESIVKNGQEEFKLVIASEEVEHIEGDLFKQVYRDTSVNPKRIVRMDEQLPSELVQYSTVTSASPAQKSKLATFLDIDSSEVDFLSDDGFYRLQSLMNDIDSIPKERRATVIEAMKKAAKKAAKGCAGQ